MKPNIKKYMVCIDMQWSLDFNVSAKNTREAKRIAFEKFTKTKALKSKNFKISAQEDKW